MATPKRAPIAFILVTVILDAMGIGLILPVMPQLLTEVRAADIGEAAVWGGILAATFAAMQFLFSPLLGNLSDRFGRRPVLLISTFVMCIDYIVMALAGTIWWLLGARVIGGITAATHSTAGAYMADISPAEKKSANFGLISACFGLGFIFGPVLGGLLAEFGSRAPFVAAAVLAGLNFLFGLLVLPETVTKENQRSFDWARANPLGGFKHLNRLPGMGALLAVWFFYQLANMVYPAIWAYFTIESFGWSAGMVGISLGVYGVSMAVVQGGLIRLLVSRFGEMNVVYVGLAFNAFVLLLVAFVPTGMVLMALIPFSALGAVVAPALDAVMSQRADDNQQGELRGVTGSLNAVGIILTQLMMTQIFFAFTRDESVIYLPGAPFLAAAVFMFVGWLVFARATAERAATEG